MPYLYHDPSIEYHGQPKHIVSHDSIYYIIIIYLIIYYQNRSLPDPYQIGKHFLIAIIYSLKTHIVGGWGEAYRNSL